MFNVRIAEINLQMDVADEAFFAARLADYPPASGEPDMIIRSSIVENLSPPEGAMVEQVANADPAATTTTFLLRTADGRMGYATRGKSGAWLAIQTYTPDYSDVDIRILASRKHSVFSLTDFEYMYTGGMFSNRIAVTGGVVLHSSSIACRGVGVAFSANSGTGKSTQTGLWCDVFGDDVIMVNDDKPVLRFCDGEVTIHGNPWSGKTALNAPIGVPLKALVFLEQSLTNSIRRLGVADSLFQLTSQICRPFYDSAVGILTLDAIEKIINDVPVYMLSCDISREAVMTVYNEVFKDIIS